MRVWILVLLFLYTGILSAEHSIDKAFYDPNGNMKMDQYRSTVLNYDRANQPISITKYILSPSSSTTYHFGYGIADNRIFKGTMSQAYYYLGSHGIYDINADKWEHYPGGVLRLKNGDIQKIVKDHLSNTRAIIGDNSSCFGVISAYDYYPFGKVLRKHENPVSRFQSTDHEKDSETGYDDRHARMYDDEAFRFIQVDPMSDMTASTYDYCSNNPIFYTDPTGMYSESEAIDQRNAAIQLGYEVSDIYKSGDEYMFNYSWKGIESNSSITHKVKYASAKSKDFAEIIKDPAAVKFETRDKYNGFSKGVSERKIDGLVSLLELTLKFDMQARDNARISGACGEPPISTFDIITLGQGGMSLYKGLNAAMEGGNLWRVGVYNEIKGLEVGLDAHHVGQKALMKNFVPGYNLNTAPSILVPEVGHTIRGVNGIVSRSTSGFTNARQVLARDIFELRRVYGGQGIPNSSLQQLIQMNKTMYPGALIK